MSVLENNLSEATLLESGDFLRIVKKSAGAGLPQTSENASWAVLVKAMALAAPEGQLINGQIDVTVASNNLIVAVKTLADADPSTDDPVAVKINGVVRLITAALSLTVNAGANTFNAGGAELATKEADYATYVSWKTGSSAVVLLISRLFHPRLYSQFSGTATSESYAAYSVAPASTDAVVICGRFAATLSAGAGYTWSVPTFTAANLIQNPIDETRWLIWVPTLVGFSAAPTNTLYAYKVVGDRLRFCSTQNTNGTSNATTFTETLPFASGNIGSNTAGGASDDAVDNGAALTTPARWIVGANSNLVTLGKDMSGAAWTNTNGKRASCYGEIRLA